MQGTRPNLVKRTLTDTLLGIYTYLAFEWLFLVTKPSFFTVLSWPERVTILATAALPFLAVVFVLWLLMVLLARALFAATKRRFDTVLLSVPMTLLLTALATLLVDNFTYTAAGIGIVSTSGATALAYLVAVSILSVVIFRKLLRRYEAPSVTSSRGSLALLVILLICSSGATLQTMFSATEVAAGPSSVGSKDIQKYNVLLFASDGVESEYISGYGYPEITTPYLDAMMIESLVFDAAISNAGRTTGSTVSMLNGKYPATTKVIFPPHTLMGADAFQHLPGLLRASGYKVFQESIRYYADGPDLNMREGFDYANSRVVDNASIKGFSGQARIAFAQTNHFNEQLWQRVRERALHLATVKPMSRAFQAATGGTTAKVYGRRDRQRIDSATAFIRESTQPFFMHIHLMNTHCCRFKPVSRRFSANFGEQSPQNREAFFLDTLVDSDRYFGEVIAELKATGNYENTLIVYSSDHTLGWRIQKPMPLVMRVPGGKTVGRVASNVQLIDVMPTVLQVLGYSLPSWIEGVSLLETPRDPLRPVFSVDGIARERVEGIKAPLSQLIGAGPPTYGVKTGVMTVCQRWYSLDFESGQVAMGTMGEHPAPCDTESLPNQIEGHRLLVRHFTSRGFSLPKMPPENMP